MKWPEEQVWTKSSDLSPLEDRDGASKTAPDTTATNHKTQVDYNADTSKMVFLARTKINKARNQHLISL